MVGLDGKKNSRAMNFKLRVPVVLSIGKRFICGVLAKS